tara:strand:- start:22 stop:408 length:387 start_codon:yes stop_codon:yes gene_type:complete
MKLVPETVYKIVNDDGTDVRPATEKKIKEIMGIIKDAKVLGDSSPVGRNVAMRIASAMLNNYELRKKTNSKAKKQTETPLFVKTDEGEFITESGISLSQEEPLCKMEKAPEVSITPDEKTFAELNNSE